MPVAMMISSRAGRISSTAFSEAMGGGRLPAAPLTAGLVLSVASVAQLAQVSGGCLDGYTDTDKRTVIPTGAACRPRYFGGSRETIGPVSPSGLAACQEQTRCKRAREFVRRILIASQSLCKTRLRAN